MRAIRFLDIARGSALECAACLDVLAAKRALPGDQAKTGKVQVEKMVALLVGLIRSLDRDRFREESPEYRVGAKAEEQQQEGRTP